MIPSSLQLLPQQIVHMSSPSLYGKWVLLLEKTALNDDEESGRALLMLGKVQFDSYRSHIFQTITTPSESLLNELRTVEEMKRQCDEKRWTRCLIKRWILKSLALQLARIKVLAGTLEGWEQIASTTFEFFEQEANRRVGADSKHNL